MFSLTDTIYQFVKETFELIIYKIQYLRDPEGFRNNMKRTGWTFDFSTTEPQKNKQ
ncbi:hypothetical protein G3A_17465 [Bacillus sp. 17376]|uniref:Uncharacterized protein n=1 Tax=Mesobacillus boroniphilus JCM 21738 TaxID=1294265 RepID=W4RWV9_9BACI|nr:hypothetical protein [Mesobacillus boroniphilus]ESU31297.1 hypothetical protein G3A_17465 [Bacillus sp. 17376]GAE48139.1 hypothetical protein JCM21738_5220 [Mesobacillus boroniphilus JCM 21738]